MARFGRQSLSRLEGVHPLLVDWAFELVTIMDCKIVSGVRDLTDQRRLVEVGASRTMDSMHLIQEDGYGHALDIAPHPVDWDDLKRFYILAGCGIALARKMNIPVRWGGDWDMDMEFDDQKFFDFGHWEIRKSYTPGVVI
jgi:peptidoglycan L-alanyl-D-glutamate endopeptidase CwlK